jgi:hypothetical protein
MNWQPIERAPKDRRILIYRPGMDRMSFGWFDADTYNKKTIPYWDCELAVIHGKAWARQFPPSHWAEITPPPIQSSDADCPQDQA